MRTEAELDEIEPQKGVCICGHGWKSHRFPTSYPDCYDHACLGLFTPQDENGQSQSGGGAEKDDAL